MTDDETLSVLMVPAFPLLLPFVLVAAVVLGAGHLAEREARHVRGWDDPRPAAGPSLWSLLHRTDGGLQ